MSGSVQYSVSNFSVTEEKPSDLKDFVNAFGEMLKTCSLSREL